MGGIKVAIGNVVERSGYAFVYDENGSQIAAIPTNGWTVTGYTSSRVNIKGNGYVYSYDECGNQVGAIPA